MIKQIHIIINNKFRTDLSWAVKELKPSYNLFVYTLNLPFDIQTNKPVPRIRRKLGESMITVIREIFRV